MELGSWSNGASSLRTSTPILHHSSTPVFLKCSEAAEPSQANELFFRGPLRQFFKSKLIVGVNADSRRHAHGLFGDNVSIQLSMLD